MTNLQNPIVPTPVNAVEIDRAIHSIQMLLDTKLNWLSNSYGRAYRHFDKKGKRIYFPEIYIGNNEYYRVTPDNDKKGTCFFVVGQEENYDYEQFQGNYLKWNVGILFWVNQEKINSTLLKTEVFTQNLIKDVRHVLTHLGGGFKFAFKIKNVQRELGEIYREFGLSEEENYLHAPYSGFRFNLEVVLQEECEGFSYDPLEALLQNISFVEKLEILKTLNFNDTLVLGALTNEQKQSLIDLL